MSEPTNAMPVNNTELGYVLGTLENKHVTAVKVLERYAAMKEACRVPSGAYDAGKLLTGLETFTEEELWVIARSIN